MKWWIYGLISFILVLLVIVGLIIITPRLFSPTIQVGTPTPTPVTSGQAPSISLTPTPTPTNTPTPTPTSTPTPTPVPPTATPIPQGGPQGIVATKVFSEDDLSLSYPANWSILTCANSNNFEFNPAGGPDKIGVICTVAIQPITILVRSSSVTCPGTVEMIGSIPTTRTVTTFSDYTQYEWCTQTNPVLNITNRVSNAGLPATSSNNYSTDIETMISTLHFTP